MTFTTRDVSKKAITVEPTSNMSNARDVMIRNNISRVIVASNNTPVGMVTEKGIASYLFKNSKEPLDEISISSAFSFFHLHVSSFFEVLLLFSTL